MGRRMGRGLVMLAGLLAGSGLGMAAQTGGATPPAGATGGGSTAAAADAPARKTFSCKVSHEPPSNAEKALSREEYDAALGLYEEMKKKNPDVARAGAIRVLLGQDKVSEAGALASAWAAEQPKNALAIATLGEVQLRAGEVNTAYSTAFKAHDLDPCLGRPYLLLSEAEDLSAFFARSKTHVEMAHRVAPTDIEIRRAWIGTLPKAKRLEQYGELAKDNTLMNETDRRRMTEYVAHAAESSIHDCEVVQAIDSATIPITRIMDGPSRQIGLALDVKFNGKGRRLEIDTGASGLVLSRGAAAGLGLVRERQVESGGVGDQGNVTTSVAHVASVKIGKLEFRNCAVAILEKRSALDIDGLIGGNVFSKFLLTLDFPKAQLRLDPLPPRPGEVAKTEKLKTDVSKSGEDGVNSGDSEEIVAHDAYFAPEMKSWTPVLRSGHDLLIPVSIGEAKNRLFLVDTGAGLMSISPGAAAAVTKVKKDNEMEVRGISGKVDQVFYTGGFTLKFAQLGQKVDQMTAMSTKKISHSDGVEVSGFLGAPILDRLTVHIDYRDNLMKFEYDPMN